MIDDCIYKIKHKFFTRESSQFNWFENYFNTIRVRFYHPIHLLVFFNKKVQYSCVLNLILSFIKNEVTRSFPRRFKILFFRHCGRSLTLVFFWICLVLRRCLYKFGCTKFVRILDFFPFDRFECFKCVFFTPTKACMTSLITKTSVFEIWNSRTIWKVYKWFMESLSLWRSVNRFKITQ